MPLSMPQAAVAMSGRPRFHAVEGAPFQPRQLVRVVGPTDPASPVDQHIGRQGVVEYLEYDCGCGQRFPDDPMIGVLFDAGDREEFWRDELARPVAEVTR